MRDKVITGLNNEEFEACIAFLKQFKEKREREETIKQTKERIRNDIKKLYDFIMPYEMADFLEEVVRIDLDLDYKWEEY